MGVFHVALGGGEAFEREDFGELVSCCREIGLVPNLTTNGQSIGEREIAICKKMGQVNISIDGINDHFNINGRNGSFKKADIAINPKSSRFQFRYKSNNKTTIARKLGLPVAESFDDLKKFGDPGTRNKEVESQMPTIIKEYNILKSAEQYRDLIWRIKSKK